MQFRKLMLVLTFTVSIIFVTVIGATYAYYTISGGSLDITTSSDDSAASVVFNNSDYIDLNTGIPISSTDVETKASKTTFTITPTATAISDYDIMVSIGLANISIDSELLVSAFKYRLVCASSVTGTEQIFNGNASSFTGENYTIANLSTTGVGNNNFYVDANASNQNYSCSLYIWLEESGSNQNSLMNKHFGANVAVDSTLKKR